MNRLQRLKMAMLANMEEKGLPSEYRAVAYLQSTGTQIIYLGMKGKGSTGVFIDFEIMPNTATSAIFGARHTQSGLDRDYLVSWGTVSSRRYYFAYNNNYTDSQYIGDFNRHTREIKVVDNNLYTYVDGTFDFSVQKKSFETVNNLALFGRIGAANRASAKIYSCKVYDENVLVRDLVPCYRKADNVAGMYDLVNDVFYTNAGTGEFIVGGEI